MKLFYKKPYFVTFRFITLVVVFGNLLAGCSMMDSVVEAIQPVPTITVDQQAVETTVAQVMATETAKATLMATPQDMPEVADTEMVEPQPVATAEVPMAQATQALDGAGCLYYPQDGAEQPLPDPAALTWQPQSGAAGRWRMLEGLFSPVMEAVSAPGGRWWAARVLRVSAAAGPAETALYVLDGAGNNHWVAAQRGLDGYHEFTWMNDGRLVWVDGGQLWMAAANGADKRDLSAPEPVYEVWVGAENRALVSAENGLWRLNLETGEWSRVNELIELAVTLGPPAFSRPQANLSLSPDGTFAALASANSLEQNSGEFWKIALDATIPAQKVGEFTYLGRGGRMSAPQPLANSPHWFLRELTGPGGDFLSTEQVLINDSNGTRLSLASLLPTDKMFLGADVSPDNQWLALLASPVGANPSEAEWSVLFVPVADLNAGASISGDAVLAWRAFPAAAWVVQQGAAGQVVKQVALQGGSGQDLSTLPQDMLPGMVVGSNTTLLFSNDRVQQFDNSGNMMADVPVPMLFAEVTTRNPTPTGEVLLAGVSASRTAEDGICQYQFPVVLWALP